MIQGLTINISICYTIFMKQRENKKTEGGNMIKGTTIKDNGTIYMVEKVILDVSNNTRECYGWCKRVNGEKLYMYNTYSNGMITVNPRSVA